jgi:hypothetical protein
MQPSGDSRPCDHCQLRGGPSQRDVQELVEADGGLGDLHEDHDLAFEALEAPDRLEYDAVLRLIGNLLRREALRGAVVVDRCVPEDDVAEAPGSPRVALVG